MYAHIRGNLIYSSPIFAVLEANGVGYKIFIPTNLFGELGAMGEEVFLFTSFVVREQSHALYGFINEEGRNLFEVLLNVSGIGPKTALSLIGHLSYEDLIEAIRREDDKILSKVPGIGKKTAERLILEVKDKLPKGSSRSVDQYTLKISTKNSKEDLALDALSALLNLGYKEAHAQKAIQKALHQGGDEIELPKLITLSLKNI